ncbi:trans-resveratrol di-O-methyltransferase-like [Gossypium australe]|uniref:Trans-resveratrol di-O-methyltransferase-like n=1 Tax=Gossypium australe TaxID=47621 RepID=A0A5B6V0V1_9ROSI|nr:trans-resveratrol di-O-methyltransferase-like [Gossypium australe]
MTFPHISRTFVLRGTIHPKGKTSRNETAKEMLRNLNINAISKEVMGEKFIRHLPLCTWKCSEQLDCGRDFYNINDMSDTPTDSESPFEQDMCMEDS